MQSLSTHIQESIYGNLGISSDTLYDDWINIYNSQRYIGESELEYFPDECKIKYKRRNSKSTGEDIRTLVIHDNALLDNGHLPAGLPLSVTDGFTLSIYANGFKSFENLPEVNYMNLYVYTQLNCFDTITNCKYISIWLQVASVITNMKPVIYHFRGLGKNRFEKFPDADMGFILKNTKGCTFGACHAADYDKPSIYIPKLPNTKKNEGALNSFFKNNKFNGLVDFGSGAVLHDLSFLYDAQTKFDWFCVSIPQSHLPGIVPRTTLHYEMSKEDQQWYIDYFKPAADNYQKFNDCMRFDVRPKKTVIKYIIGKAYPQLRLKDMSI